MFQILQNIVIIGGGGNLGQIILRGLLLSPDLSITAIKRPGSTSTLPTSPNLRIIESDLSLNSLISIFTGQDAVISIVGATGIGEQKVYVDAAVQAGVKRFLPSEFGINGQSEVVKKLTPFFKVKQDLLNYLGEKEQDGLSWTAVIAGVLYDWCLDNGFMGFDIGAQKAFIWDDGNTRFSGIDSDDLGKAVVNIFHKPAETANKFMYISSLTATQNETLEALEKATSSKWGLSRLTTSEQVDGAQEALAKGQFSGALTLVKATCWSNLPGLKQHFEVDEKENLANDVLDLGGGKSVQDVVDKVVASRKAAIEGTA